ncbi:MAG: ElyC/SanA/YdcF family protein [Patescibacteria group bacterium]
MTQTSQVTEKVPYAIILGASVLPDGRPSDALRDRLLVGEALYREGKVEKLLVTGDDGGFRSDEVDSMKAYLLSEGVPEDAITVDGKGYRTYESCKRAHEEFHIDRAIVITQRFHMGRALYLCNELGVESKGMTADLEHYTKIKFFWARDLAASVLASWDINEFKSTGEMEL